ncbi:MAG: bifunctional 5,10-methylene-tetrahydrofolate dehydrogenase/5,10-methylene-tetrahydrofolate cyclohydrolase [Proteobacteria bacterium]|nr:bifunctional 5,10-methylene-tetrahydrofolate dehydrogenase/5,10-methylene-tetrahydrofolate cyclohydrolase [Pseudomonadota bacterium]
MNQATAINLRGAPIAKRICQDLKQKIGTLQRAPSLAVVLVGADPASQVYVSKKGQRARKIGFSEQTISLSEHTSQDELLSVIDALNEDDSVDGILVQLPLPKHIDSSIVLSRVDAAKDVDGFHALNAGSLFLGSPLLVPCTAAGVMELLFEAQRTQGLSEPFEIKGRHAVVLGRSNIVGRPTAALLEQANATVTVCHSRTQNVEHHLAMADIVVAAVGRPEFVRGEQLKKGAVVIDVGINRLSDGRLVGDVHYDSASKVARFITPVPGGVGPLTIAMLMSNTYKAFVKRCAS